MTKRSKIPASTEAELFLQSRRRCCICYGLHRDESRKNGQIAHLDGNPSNNRLANLVFLCFDHHDEYDSSTSQAKGLTKAEVERYREELVSHYGQWRVSEYPNTLLSFLASTIDMRAMAEGAIRLAKQIVFHGEALAHQILTTDNIDYCDSDLYEPYLAVLEHYAAWGWLIFTYEERAIPDDMPRVYIEVKRKPICDEVASMIEKIRSDHQAGSAPSGATFETT